MDIDLTHEKDFQRSRDLGTCFDSIPPTSLSQKLFQRRGRVLSKEQAVVFHAASTIFDFRVNLGARLPKSIQTRSMEKSGLCSEYEGGFT